MISLILSMVWCLLKDHTDLNKQLSFAGFLSMYELFVDTIQKPKIF